MQRAYRLLCRLLLVAVAWQACLAAPRHVIHLAGGDIDTRRSPHTRHSAGDDYYGASEAAPYLVHFTAPLASATPASVVEAIGTRAAHYVPNDALLMLLTADEADTLAALPEVDWVSLYQPDHKISAPLRERTPRARQNRANAELGDLFVLVHPSDEDAAALAAQWTDKLRSMGVHAEAEVVSPRKVMVSTPHGSLRTASELLAREPHVHWVEGARTVASRNRYSHGVAQSGNFSQSPVWDAGLQGQGELLGIGDTGIDTDLCFFRDLNVPIPYNTVNLDHRKIVSYLTLVDDYMDEAFGHGTHTSGTLAGAALSGVPSLYNGAAPQAKLVFQDIGDPSGNLFVPNDLNTGYFPVPYQIGARVHSNSWGADTTQYDSMCAEVDQFQFDHQDFLVVIAAGNTGTMGDSSVATPGNAKNGLSVGASEAAYQSALQRCGLTGDPVFFPGTCQGDELNNVQTHPEQYSDENIASFSSRGPTNADGRVKPDIVAPGQYILSASSDGNNQSNYEQCGQPGYLLAMQGTSMAAPAVAGNAGLVRQYFREGWFPTGAPVANNSVLPSANLVRAVMLNGAHSQTGLIDLTGRKQQYTQLAPAPSYIQGFGRVSLADSIFITSPQPVGLAARGDSLRYFDAPNGLSTAQTTAPWCWRTAATLAPDARLAVTLSWADYPSTPAAGGRLVNDLDLTLQAGTEDPLIGNRALGLATADRVNNVEQIVVSGQELKADTDYCVRVTGFSIPQGPQPFAIVLTGPLAGEGAPTQRGVHLTPGEIAGISAGVVVVIVIGAAVGVAVAGRGAVAVRSRCQSCGRPGSSYRGTEAQFSIVGDEDAQSVSLSAGSDDPVDEARSRRRARQALKGDNESDLDDYLRSAVPMQRRDPSSEEDFLAARADATPAVPPPIPARSTSMLQGTPEIVAALQAVGSTPAIVPLRVASDAGGATPPLSGTPVSETVDATSQPAVESGASSPALGGVPASPTAARLQPPPKQGKIIGRALPGKAPKRPAPAGGVEEAAAAPATTTATQ